MSTDWIKMRVDLRTHPKVVRMSSALKADRLRVIGALFAVWSIFDAHSSDGILEGYTLDTLDDDLHWPGFAKAMMGIDWLVYDPDQGEGLLAPRFEEHNGQSAKRRAMETERKRLEREAAKPTKDAKTVTEKAGQMSASDADTKRTREEKRREERDKETVKLPLDSSRPKTAEEGDELDLGLPPGKTPKPKGPPACPHLAVLALWGEVMPDMPQHLPSQWKGTRSDHLRARWKETAVEKAWTDEGQGLTYLRKLFAYCRQSAFLSGQVPPSKGHRQFELELAWLVNPTNWAKVHEGFYHGGKT